LWTVLGLGLSVMRHNKVIPWEVRDMTKKQMHVVIGMILGDAYLQKTGKQNARLRLEQSAEQKAYLEWKIEMLSNYFQSKIQTLSRTNTIWRKTYRYVRIQSLSGSEFGKLQRIFYKDSRKIIPENITSLLYHPLSLAVWFMDDGYYYHRDNDAYIYIPNYDELETKHLLECLKTNFHLMPTVQQKKKGKALTFDVAETKKLMEKIEPLIIPSMKYKTSLDPVSTDRNLP